MTWNSHLPINLPNVYSKKKTFNYKEIIHLNISFVDLFLLLWESYVFLVIIKPSCFLKYEYR